MGVKRMQFWRNLSIQAKMLGISLPLIVMPMLILVAVGYVTSSREAAKAGTHNLKQRENDLHTLAENPIIRDCLNNRVHGLSEKAEVFRLDLEHSLRRPAVRSNSIDLIYPQIRYVGPWESAFLASISHELRTPLNAIIDSSEVVLEPRFGQLTANRQRIALSLADDPALDVIKHDEHKVKQVALQPPVPRR